MLDSRKLAAEALALDLLAFADDSRASTDSELKVRAQVLVARVDLEATRLARRCANVD